GLAGDVKEGGEGLVDEVVFRATALASRAELAMRREPNVDQARVDGPELPVPDSPRIHLTGREAFDDHVRARGKLTEERPAIGRREIDRTIRATASFRQPREPFAEPA